MVCQPTCCFVITQEDYDHAVKVWDAFGCKKFEDYLLLYLESDVALLADVFESFQAHCLKIYGLDPVWYYTLPGFGWSAMLKKTGVKLELLTDIDMHTFVERGIRGGN